MMNFMLILLVVIVAFGDSFAVMSYANKKSEEFMPDPKGFIGGVFYAYLIGLGEFSYDFSQNVASTYCQILFIVNTVFTTIIMLNLFIAIISNSFQNINSQGEKASFREKAGLIAENQFLLSMEARMNWAEKNKYLLYVNTLNHQDGEDPDVAKNRTIITESMKKVERKITAAHLDIVKTVEKLTTELKKFVHKPAEELMIVEKKVVQKKLPLKLVNLQQGDVVVQCNSDGMSSIKDAMNIGKNVTKGGLKIGANVLNVAVKLTGAALKMGADVTKETAKIGMSNLIGGDDIKKFDKDKLSLG